MIHYRYNNKTISPGKVHERDIPAVIDKLFTTHKLFINPTLRSQDLCNLIGIQAFQLRAIIKLNGYKNFQSYLNYFRIQEAKKLLTDQNHSNQTMEEIALGCGFSTRQTFYNAFRATVGCTPQSYRNGKP